MFPYLEGTAFGLGKIQRSSGIRKENRPTPSLEAPKPLLHMERTREAQATLAARPGRRRPGDVEGRLAHESTDTGLSCSGRAQAWREARGPELGCALGTPNALPKPLPAACLSPAGRSNTLQFGSYRMGTRRRGWVGGDSGRDEKERQKEIKPGSAATKHDLKPRCPEDPRQAHPFPPTAQPRASGPGEPPSCEAHATATRPQAW